MFKNLAAASVVSALLAACLLVYIQKTNTLKLEEHEGVKTATLSHNHSICSATNALTRRVAHSPTGAEVAPTEEEEAQAMLDADETLHSLTSKKQHELPVLKAAFNADDEHHLKSADNVFFQTEHLGDKYRVADIGLMGLVAKSQSMVYSDLYVHRYDNFNDLKLATGPAVDNELCLRQLSNLTARAERLAREKYRSRDFALFRLLDTWARVPAGLMSGNLFMEGMYSECKRLTLDMDNVVSPTRYCIVALKHTDWPTLDKYDILAIKAGVCVPKSCDSTNYKNKFELLKGLLLHNMRPIEEGQFKVGALYCLPDEDSPLRSMRNSPQVVVTIACLALWLSLLLYSTCKHHRLRELYEHPESDETTNKFGLSNVSAQAHHTPPPPGAGHDRFKLYQMLSITHNLQALFDTSKATSLLSLESAARNEAAHDEPANQPSQADEATRRELAQLDRLERETVRLSSIEGIKVIATVYVIMGHVLMCITSIMQNGREMATNTSLAFIVANLVPAFAVNSFFTITGILTCYLLLRQNERLAIVTSPARWAMLAAYRYLRIMPMYALMVLYCKTLAKYTGAGPLWDYGTSALGQRRMCEQEPWLWTLTFASNYLPPLEHCIPAGWYLSNDFQFFLLTPFLMALLHKRPRMGQLLLYGAIIAGYLAGFYSIFSSPMADFRPIAMFAPHGFKTYVSHFSNNYTQPQYRVPAYLIGLLIGHKLYLFERSRRAYAAARRRQLAEASARGEQPPAPRPALPDWSAASQRYSVPACLLLVSVCCATPIIGSMLPFNKPAARFMVALITPSYHVLFALAVGTYVLMSTTGHGNKQLDALLSASFWKPLARVSLCAMLVNVEVINYFVQTNTNLHHITNQFQAALNCLCIVATYLVAIVVCVLFEAPIRATLNTILIYALSKASKQDKSSSTKID